MAKTTRAKTTNDTVEWGLRPTRREFLAYMSAAVAVAACGDDDNFPRANDVPPAPILADDPFLLGVASGDPLPESVLLWTRLAPAPTTGGGMPDVDVPVIWEIALDEDFRDIVGSGWEFASPQLAHSLHIDADGLAPDTWYWYRFRIDGQWTSPVGRTRTLPAADAHPESFTVVVASCQNYVAGFYTAHAHIAEEDVDLVAFVGDYIYEGGGSGQARTHVGPKLRTLEHYRNRYGQYRSDPNLQAAHQRCPWVVTWDDHEVSNNYAGLVLQAGEEDVEDVLALRRSAYQAYYEHMPVRLPVPDDFGFLQIYQSLDVGDLARICVLDGRQYRTDQACNDRIVRCPEVDEPGRTMLGLEQKQWLKEQLTGSTTIWNILAQQTVFTPVVIRGSITNNDQWDGYAVEQQELLTLFQDIRNVVIVTGDIHLAGFGVLRADARDFDSPVVGYEVVTTSISSNGDSTDTLGNLLEQAIGSVPNIEYINARNRGYSLCRFERDRAFVEYRVVSTVLAQTATVRTDHGFEIEADTLVLTDLG
jgi:alkaline phosphatase D